MARFDDIIGYENEKEELRKICDMLKNREKYLRFGITPPRTLLLWGEPGVGKTLMAKVLIDESGRKSFSCRKDRSDGEFVNAIRETFDKAKENAPSVILLDDMDKFAEDNLHIDSNKEEFVTIQACLDNLGECDVFVIATANSIGFIPDSLLRSGRFGSRIEVDFPTYGDTVKIIAHFLDGKSVSSDVTPEKLAKLIDGKSCAVLEEVISLAGSYAVYAGKDAIDMDDVVKAATRVIFRSVENEKMSDDAKKLIAYHEAGHVIGAVAAGIKVGFASVIGFAEAQGCVSCYDKNTYTSYEEVLDDVTEYMAGKLTDKKVNGEKLARLAERGYVGKDGEINVTVFKGTKSAFRDALPSPEADLLDEAASLALESALVEAKRYPPQMQDLIVSYNSVPVDTVCALMALDILYANGTFKPLTEREKVAANLIMFSDVLPG